MPYSSKSELPAAVKRLPGHGQRVFKSAFNAAHRQYSGDETTAFKVAWAAVKHKYKKSGNEWVAKQDAGGRTVHQLLADLKTFYMRALDQAEVGDMVRIKGAMDLIDQVALNPDKHEPQNDFQQLQQLQGKCVLALGFDLTQHMGYTPTVPHEHDFAGSLNHRIRCVCKAAKEQIPEYLGPWGFVLAVYPDHIVTCAEDDYLEGSDKDYWCVEYEFDEDCGEVTFGDAEPVDVATIVVNKGEMSAMDGDDDDTQSQDALGQMEGKDGSGEYGNTKPSKGESNKSDGDGQDFKTDNGQKFGKAAYLIIGDPKSPSTWKVRVEETPGHITVPQLGRAYAALTKGFRGNTVQAGSDAKTAALAKLKGLNKTHGGEWPGEQDQGDIPDWLAQGKDPPGGDTELVQTNSVQLQWDGEKHETGVMRVSGVATRANVVNSKNEVYPLDVWQDNLPRLQRLAQGGKLVGECQHPADGRASLDRTCIKYEKLWLDGNDLKFEGLILPTEPHGKNIQLLIQNNVAVDLSSRGRGTLKQGDWEGVTGVSIVQRGFRCDAFDPVVAGASPGSQITDWQMQSADHNDTEEDVETKELLEKIAASMETVGSLAATVAKQGEILAELGKTKEVTQDKNTEPTADEVRAQKLNASLNKMATRQRIEDLTQEIKERRKWGQQWVNKYRQLIENAKPETEEAVDQAASRAEEIVEGILDQAPHFPGNGFTVQADKGERGFRNGSELLDDLVKDLPDTELAQSHPDTVFRRRDEQGNPIFPGHFRTPRRQMRKWMENIARHQDANFNGPGALKELVLLSQGYDPSCTADQVLFQDCSAAGSTTVGNSGAPQSAIFIFPLVRRVFPQLIATELASVQPMDRPDGKIFFLDSYRQSPGVDSKDSAGATVSGEMRIDRSDSFSSSYSNNPGECQAVNTIQLRLSSISVTADNKKLQAVWTIEELQDLRAYHGLDASLELVGSLSREIALEWNETVLNELTTGATGANLTFGTTNPTGYTQKEWDEYLSRMLDSASAQVFKKRHGDITHIVAGPDAWVKLAATFRVGTHPRDGANPEQYAGLTLTPFMQGTLSNVKTYKTSFWSGVNTNTIMVLRRGADWSDTPYVWAPYLDYVSPVLTLPNTFNQNQGIMSRVAHKVVVSEAIANISIQQGVTGVPL
jgi:cation transport regulator